MVIGLPFFVCVVLRCSPFAFASGVSRVCLGVVFLSVLSPPPVAWPPSPLFVIWLWFVTVYDYFCPSVFGGLYG